MRSLTRRGLVGFAIVALAAGCGASAKEQTLSAGDLRRITTVRPMTPGWGFSGQALDDGRAVGLHVRGRRELLEPVGGDEDAADHHVALLRLECPRRVLRQHGVGPADQQLRHGVRRPRPARRLGSTDASAGRRPGNEACTNFALTFQSFAIRGRGVPQGSE